MIILLLREKREIADGTGLYTFHIQALKKKKKKLGCYTTQEA